MKKSTVLIALTLGAALMIGATGCKHGPVDTMNIPGHTIIPGQGGPNNPGIDIGTPVPSSEPPTTFDNPTNTPEGIPTSDKDQWTDTMNNPHNENHEFFAKDTVYFDTDSSVIKSPEQSKLDDIAKYLKDNPKDVLTIEGYCDERGTEGYNLALGDRRSLAVREFLVTLGVESGRIHTVSFGEANPVDPGHNEAAWKQNRRGVSVLIEPK